MSIERVRVYYENIGRWTDVGRDAVCVEWPVAPGLAVISGPNSAGKTVATRGLVHLCAPGALSKAALGLLRSTGALPPRYDLPSYLLARGEEGGRITAHPPRPGMIGLAWRALRLTAGRRRKVEGSLSWLFPDWSFGVGEEERLPLLMPGLNSGRLVAAADCDDGNRVQHLLSRLSWWRHIRMALAKARAALSVAERGVRLPRHGGVGPATHRDA